MKVLIAANNDVGLYRFRKELIKKLLEEHQVMISLPYGELVEPLKEAGCLFIDTFVDRRGLNPFKDLSLFIRYQKILKTHKPDLVITYTIKPNIYGALACRMKKIPYAVNITGLGTAFQKKGLLRSFVTLLYRSSLKKSKVVFFENDGNRQLFIDERIVPKAKTVLLNGAGVSLEHFAMKPYHKTGPVRFLFVGRVMQEKGINELFFAMERLREEGADCTLDVLGGYEEDYAETILRYEEKGWLRYHGYQKDVRPFIERAHCFVLPSYHEGMANTNLECASMGRPVITSNIPGCKEAVLDGKSGFLCEPKDTESLYAAMRRFLSLSIQQQATMGLIGRKHMEEYFDKQMVVHKTVEHLK